MRDLYKEKRDILLSALEDMGLETKASAATFYVWQRVPEGLSDTEFASKLLDNENAIIVTPGSLISDQCDDINPGSGYVRFALMPTMEEMHEAADRLRNMKF
jgi:LL-diaminopimelate aminotransferase